MIQRFTERVHGLAERAGLGGLGTRSLAAALAVGALLVLLAAWRFWPRAAPPEDTFGSAVGASGGASGAPQAAAPSDAALFVHVVGAVLHPGVYELPRGSRVVDAIDAAGGALGSADVCALNLARVLADGEQVLVPVVGAASTDTDGGAVTGAVDAADGTVNINTADLEELQTLPGVGPSTAEKIIADREANGPFATPEDLMRVTGIGEKKFEAMRELVRTR